MLVPKRVKFRKQFRGKMRGLSQRANKLDFGSFGLKAQSRGWVSSRQIESARKAVAHYTKRMGKLWIRIFPDKPISKKPPETRMGGGKGDIFEYVAVVKPGRVIFELDGTSEVIAKEAFRLAGAKFSVRTKFIVKD